MLEKSFVFTRKRAVTIVLLCAAAILFLISLCWHNSRGIDLRTQEGREMFLLELGWEVDLSTEEHKSVQLPEELDGVIGEYNRMQLEQGFDLNKHLGQRCDCYTYEITNYPGCSDTVLITIYVQGRKIIAGDIHTAAIDGFMHGIKKE